MANAFIDTSLVDKAIRFAVNAHANSERRGKGFPYIVHPMEAMEIVSTITTDPELIAAAALHDTVEDTSVTIDDIRREFGDRIAGIVKAESDEVTEGTKEEDTWHARKKAAIDRLAQADRDTKIVAMGDKLSNMRAIYRDYMVQGDELWKIFHAKDRSDHEWHYRGLADSLSELSDTFAYQEFVRLINSVFGAKGFVPRVIDLARDYVRSGDSYTCVSYDCKNNPDRMVKIYNDGVPRHVAEKEIVIADAVYQMGIASPRPIGLVMADNKLGVEFERIINKRSYARAISQEPENLEKYAATFARYCKKIHSTPCRTDIFTHVVDIVKKDIEISDLFDDAKKKQIISFIDSVPVTHTCLHGDMHIGNLLMAGGKNYWIDLGDFSYGNPLFDLGMVYFTCNSNIENVTMDLYHVNNETMGKIWNVFVKEYFGPDADLDEINKKIVPFAALRMIHLGNAFNLFPEMKEFIMNTSFDNNQ
ncbi:MAG: HD domain-containing protein [Bacteroidales bacterium]|nr:HD domain-containing protein [Bacteroidales bacterium]